MKRQWHIKRLILCISLFAVVAFLFASAGIAEVKTPTASPKGAVKIDEAALIIQSQRYKYAPVDRDIFRNIFLHLTAPPSVRVTKTPIGATPEPTEIKPVDRKTARLNDAKQDCATLQNVTEVLMKQKKYEMVIEKVDAFGKEYEDLGEDLGPIMAPLAPTYTKAQEYITVVASFKDLCASIKVLSILNSENQQSAILSNGAFVKKGDIIAELFGPSAPKDFKVINITPDSIVLGSEEMKLSTEIFLNPKDADKKK